MPRKKNPTPSKKKIVVSTSKWDNRDKPAKVKKQAMLANVTKLLKESERQEKELIAKAKARKLEKQSRSGNAMLKKAKDASSHKTPVSKKPTKSKSKRKKVPRKKYVYINEYLKDLKPYKKKGKPGKADAKELKRVKKNLQNQTYRIKDTLKSNYRKRLKKNKLSKTTRNKLHKKLRNLSVAVRGINVKLGTKKPVTKLPEHKVETKRKKEKKGKKEVVKVTKKEYMPVWEGQAFLTELLKGKQFKTYIVNGSEFPASHQPEIYIAYSKMEDSMHGVGSSTPHVIFYMRITDKICEISPFS